MAVPAAFLLAWSACAHAGWPSARAVPRPGDVLALALREMSARDLWLDLVATLGRVAAGVTLATVAGGALGVLVGRSRALWRAVEPSVDFLRAVPPLLVFPIFLLALGYGDGARVAAIAFGTAPTVMLHVAGGIACIPSGREETVRLAGIRGVAAVRVLYAWEVVSPLVTGVRIAVALGLVIAVVTEMVVGAAHGLGARALDAQLGYRADMLWLVVILAGAVGQGLSSVLARLERRVVHWRPCA